MAANPEIRGHPTWLTSSGEIITVCASCGQLRTILFLACDRWFCTKCRAEGAAPPNLYPIA